MSLRKDVSNILGYTIPEGRWKKAFKELQVDGRLTNKHIFEILVLLLEREENREENRSV